MPYRGTEAVEEEVAPRLYTVTTPDERSAERGETLFTHLR